MWFLIHLTVLTFGSSCDQGQSFILRFCKAHCNPVQSFQIINYRSTYYDSCSVSSVEHILRFVFPPLTEPVHYPTFHKIPWSDNFFSLSCSYSLSVKATWVGMAGWCLSLFISGLLELRLTRVFLLFLMIFLESLINTVSSGGKGRVAASKLLQ